MGYNRTTIFMVKKIFLALAIIIGMVAGIIGISIGSLLIASHLQIPNNTNEQWVNKDNRDPVYWEDGDIIVYLNPEKNFYYAIRKGRQESNKEMKTYCVKINPNYDPNCEESYDNKERSCKYYIDDGIRKFFNMEIKNKKRNENNQQQYNNNVVVI